MSEKISLDSSDIRFCYVKSSWGNPRIQVKSADSSVGIDQ